MHRLVKVATTMQSLAGIFVPKISAHEPLVLRIIKYFIRLGLLGVAMFILIIWPVDSYTPTGFDEWSTRMENLPDQVWYLLFFLILSWASAEIYGAVRKPDEYKDITPEPPQDFMDDNFKGYKDI